MQAARQNVLTQLENLQTHPAVATRLAQGRLKLHGWMYRFETGEVWAYEPSVSRFVPLIEPSESAGSFHILDRAEDTGPQAPDFQASPAPLLESMVSGAGTER